MAAKFSAAEFQEAVNKALEFCDLREKDARAAYNNTNRLEGSAEKLSNDFLNKLKGSMDIGDAAQAASAAMQIETIYNNMHKSLDTVVNDIQGMGSHLQQTLSTTANSIFSDVENAGENAAAIMKYGVDDIKSQADELKSRVLGLKDTGVGFLNDMKKSIEHGDLTNLESQFNEAKDVLASKALNARKELVAIQNRVRSGAEFSVDRLQKIVDGLAPTVETKLKTLIPVFDSAKRDALKITKPLTDQAKAMGAQMQGLSKLGESIKKNTGVGTMYDAIFSTLQSELKAMPAALSAASGNIKSAPEKAITGITSVMSKMDAIRAIANSAKTVKTQRDTNLMDDTNPHVVTRKEAETTLAEQSKEFTGKVNNGVDTIMSKVAEFESNINKITKVADKLGVGKIPGLDKVNDLIGKIEGFASQITSKLSAFTSILSVFNFPLTANVGTFFQMLQYTCPKARTALIEGNTNKLIQILSDPNKLTEAGTIAQNLGKSLDQNKDKMPVELLGKLVHIKSYLEGQHGIGLRKAVMRNDEARKQLAKAGITKYIKQVIEPAKKFFKQVEKQLGENN